MRSTAALVTSAALTLTACGGGTATVADSTPAVRPSPTASGPAPGTTSLPTPPARPSATPSAPAAPGTVITTAGSDFGPMLFDAKKQAIYLFDKEKTSTPECYDACAEAWPPVLTRGAPRAAEQARSALLGTTARRDGTTQVTYAGHPLYFYAHEGPGQVLCHNVPGFGGLWLVVTPAGDAAPAR